MTQSFYRIDGNAVANPAFEELVNRLSTEAVFLKSASPAVLKNESIYRSAQFVLYLNKKMISTLTTPDLDELAAHVYASINVRTSPTKTVAGKSGATEQTSKTGSLSSLPSSIVDEEFNVNIKKIIRSSKPFPDEFLPLRNENLDMLFESVYSSLEEEVGLGEFPSKDVNEATQAGFVQIVLDKTILFMRSQFNLTDDQIKQIKRFKHEHFTLYLPGEVKDAYADFSVGQLEDDLDDLDDEKKKKVFLVVAEVKKGTSRSAVKQCVVYLKTISETNKAQTVYGICANGREFRFLSLNSSGNFQLLHPIPFMYETMFDSGQKTKWLKNCTSPIRILFSILCDKLSIPL